MEQAQAMEMLLEAGAPAVLVKALVQEINDRLELKEKFAVIQQDYRAKYPKASWWDAYKFARKHYGGREPSPTKNEQQFFQRLKGWENKHTGMGSVANTVRECLRQLDPTPQNPVRGRDIQAKMLEIRPLLVAIYSLRKDSTLSSVISVTCYDNCGAVGRIVAGKELLYAQKQQLRTVTYWVTGKPVEYWQRCGPHYWYLLEPVICPKCSWEHMWDYNREGEMVLGCPARKCN